MRYPSLFLPFTYTLWHAFCLYTSITNKRTNMNMNIIESWWRHNGIWDREQASGILVENYDGETALYLESTDDWWDDLTDIQKQQVYEEFFEEV